MLSWFDATHELAADMGGVRWRRVAWVSPGSVGEQDARLLAALDYTRRIANDAIQAYAPKTNDPNV